MPSYQTENRAVIERLQLRLNRFAHPDATPLMLSWRLIITEDNRSGILAGLDKDGNPMKPVTYRPVQDASQHINIRGKAAGRLRHGQSGNRLRDLLFRGVGPHAVGLHNNLTGAEYRRLTGPPLAPRGQFSRVISNFKTTHEPLNPGPDTKRWVAIGYWDEVVATDGVFQFLKVHFQGLPLGRGGPSKIRDLRGVRPEGQARLLAAYQAWANDHVMYAMSQ